MTGSAKSVAAGIVAILAAVLPAAAVVDATTAAPAPTVTVRAADADDFEPGMLISDERFYDATTMGAAEVQTFFERISCRPSDDVDCLADYHETTLDVPAAGTGHCGEYRGKTAQSAAAIVAGVALACGINPQVLLVMMQKEQSLVTRPSASGYERAMGYACPDTADCDAEYFGFFNQVYNSAWQFRQYTLFPTDRAFEVGVREIGYSPDVACGAGAVDILNQATANLYNYTPYQPNDAAVQNLYGDGDECSAYGNRNFWRIFTDWFGDPTNTRFPAWLGPCISNVGGKPCLDEFWRERPER